MEKYLVGKKTSVKNVYMITMIAVLSAIAFVLAFFEFPVPLSPSFARLDLSDLPALIGAFVYGPMASLFHSSGQNWTWCCLTPFHLIF